MLYQSTTDVCPCCGNIPLWVKSTCRQCGTEFPTRRSTVLAGKALFCSRRCFGLWFRKPRRDLRERFMEKVVCDLRTGCWIWIGATDHNGYGSLGARGRWENGVRVINRSKLAHRVAWELEIGPIPLGMQVLHNCPSGDNPSCVRPSHMFLGVHQDNMDDMWRKGRARPGHPLAFVPPLGIEVARLIRAERIAGASVTTLAERYAVTRPTINRILRNVTYRAG